MGLKLLDMLLPLLILSTLVFAGGAPGGLAGDLPVTLTNQQNIALTQNSQIMLTVNSLAYKSYEAPNLQNIEFFYSNGTVIPSWMEGNALNEQQTNSLYTSANTVYWLRIYPASTFLAANSANTIYMGFFPTAVNEFSNTITGEAPQLSCSGSGNTVNTITCNGIYAQYDNGANVFPLYLNFQGVSSAAPAGWTYAGVSSTLSIDNGITLYSASGESAAIYEGSTVLPTGNVIDSYILSSTRSSDELVGFSTTGDSGTNSGWWGITGNAVLAGAGGGTPPRFEMVYVTNGAGSNARYSLNPGGPYVASDSWQGTNGIATWNYSVTESSSSVNTAAAAYPMLYVNNNQTIHAQWFRMRSYPPGGTMPDAQFGSIRLQPSLSLANSIASNAIDVLIGSPSDNALITATCASGDTCEIESSSGNVLASAANTVSIAYNSLDPGSTALFANDITSGLASNNAYVRRITADSTVAFKLTSTQATAVPANTSLMISFNALAYASEESNTLNNTAIAFSNGTVAYSWLEGNLMNEENSLPATLSSSSNVIYWFDTPSNTFLTADTGNAVSNVAYLVFGPTDNVLLDGNFVGEAPQLSCSNANAMSCNGIYAQYDNGAKVFTAYYNFAGNTMPAGFNTTDAANLVVDNGISFTGTGTTNQDQVTLNATYGRPVSIDELAAVTGTAPVYDLGYADTTNSFQNGYQISGLSVSDFDLVKYAGGVSTDMSPNTEIASTYNAITLTLGSNQIQGEVQYMPIVGHNDTTYNGFHPFFGSWWNDKYVHAQWFRIRSSVSESSVSSSILKLSVSMPSPLMQSVTQGSTAEISSNASGGIGPYTYQWYAALGAIPAATSANAAEANTLLGTGTSNGLAQSQNAIFATSTGTATGTYWFVLHAASGQSTANSVAANVIVSAAPSPTAGGGGAGVPQPSAISISDNINSNSASAAPVFTVDSQHYYQNQLPAGATYTGSLASVSFACSVTINGNVYDYQHDAYGLGYGAVCNQTYQTGIASIEAIYTLRQNAGTSASSTATVTASTTAEQSTVRTTVPATTAAPTTTVSGYVSNILTVSANAPVQLNVTPFMTLKISSSNQSSQQVRISVKNETPQSTAPVNYSKIFVFAVSATPSGNLTVNTTIEYNCSLNPGVVPFAYVNGTWQQVYNAVVLQNPCRIEFPAQNGHVVGIFERSLSPAGTSQAAGKSQQQEWFGWPWIYALAAVLSALLIFFAYRIRRGRSSFRR